MPGSPPGTSSPLAVVVAPGLDAIDGTVERHLRAMADHPELTLSISIRLGCETSSSSVLGRWLPEDTSGPTMGVADGRSLAEALLVTGGDPTPVPSVVAVRAASLDGSALPRPWSDPGGADPRPAEWYRWMVGLLVQGPAWLDPEPGFEGTSSNDGRALWEQWPSVIAFGRELGLLDRPGDPARAVIAWTRQAAALLEAEPVANDRAAGTDMVAATLDRWYDLMDEDAAAEAPLPLHVALESPGAARKGSGPLGPLTEQTSVLEGSENSSMTDRVRAVAAASDLPVVLLRAGERLEVADRAQLLSWLADGVPGSGARIDTPNGPDLRLFPASPGSLHPGSDGRAPLLHALRAVPANLGTEHDWLPRLRSAKPQPLHTFVVVAPGYTSRHGGIVALHRLCDRLNAAGYDAFLHPIGFSHEIRPDWLTPLLRGRSAKDAVAIYPETVSGNELGAERVVRWLLNRPGRIHGNAMDEGPDDLIVTFSEQVSNQHPVLSVPLIDPQAFFPKDRRGSGALLWIGKGNVPPAFDRCGTRLITNSWPRGRRHFGQVLRAADVLYTCDWLTSVIDESLMCGTPVVLVGDQEWSRDEIVMRPGMVWENGDLDAAHREVGGYFAHCIAGMASVDAAVEEFVQLVNDHFDPAPSARLAPGGRRRG